MNETSQFLSIAALTSSIARSALPNAPVVDDAPRPANPVWRASRRAISQMLRWLADVTEPAVDIGSMTSIGT